MAPEGVLDVERCGAEALAHHQHLARRHEQEDGIGIEKAPYEPGTGDAVDLGARPRYPDGAALAVAARQLGVRDERQARIQPALVAVLEDARLLAEMAEPG